MSQAPSDHDLLARSGWPVNVASILHRVGVPRMIAALIDANGDGAHIEYEMWHRDGDGVWRTTYSAGAGRRGEGWVQGVSFLFGYSPGVSAVQVEWRDSTTDVPVGTQGWWIFLADAPPNTPPPRPLPTAR